jgi:hypothetical protein
MAPDRAAQACAQINLLIRCPPQPASARTIDSKHADVTKALKMFTALPLPQTDETLACIPREVSKNEQSGDGAYVSDIHIDA